MSNEYMTELINASLKDCGYEELPLKPKKIIVNDLVDDNITNDDQNVKSIMVSSNIQQDEFLTSYVKNFIDVCRNSNPENTVDDFCYLYLSIDEEERFMDAFERSKKFDNVFRFVDATIVPRGLMSNYKTVKFIDQNENTLPVWAKKVNAFNNVSQGSSEFSTKDGSTFELLDEGKIYLNVDNNTCAEITDECDFWNDVKSSFDIREKQIISQKVDNLNDDFDYLSKKENVKKYPTDVSLTWNITNDCELSRTEKIEKNQSKQKFCFWQKIIQHIRSFQDGCEKAIFIKKFKKLIDNLIQEYMNHTKKTNISIYSNFNIFFSIYRKKIYESIKQLKILHSKSQNQDCSICKRYFSSSYFPYIIVYLMMIYIKKPYELIVENE